MTDKIELEGRVSEVLLEKLEGLLDEYNVKKIVYANGPGSYMSIKLTYILLHTIKVLRGIDFAGVSAFELNDDKPIKAMGNLYFTKEKETIMTQKFNNSVKQEFWLPNDLSVISLCEDNTPHYILPAV